ncbi:MAG TPA: sialidase family protein [Mycobacteriales bacterium]|nr:sialidase family protein [Mycobacteriales bacterium]
MRVPSVRRAALGAAVLAGSVALVPAAASTGGRAFSTPVHVDLVNLTAEPSIAVAPDGTEYIVAPDGPGVRTPGSLGNSGFGGSLVWRSDDQGRTWKDLGNYDVPTGGADTDIAVAPDGTLYASGLSIVACSTVSRSTNKGASWLPMPLAGCGRQPLANDRQWTAVYGNDVVYTAIGDTGNNQVDLVRSTTTNPVVLPNTRIQLSVDPDYQWPGTVAVDQRNGRTYTVWNTQGDPNDCDGAPGAGKCQPAQASTKKPDQVMISALPDGATSAPPPITVASRGFDTFDSFVVVAVDRSGGLYVVWSERHPAAHATWAMLATSHDGGATWSRPVQVNRVPRTAVFPWVTAGDRGRIAVSYYGSRAAGISPQQVAKTAQWSVYSSFSTDGGRHFSEYRTTPTMHRGAICTSGTDCAPGTRNLLDFFETDLDPNGCLVTAFADDTVDPQAAPAISYVRQTRGPGLLAGHRCVVPR